MIRRLCALTSAVAVGLGLAFAPVGTATREAVAPPTDARPNIVFLLADDLRFDGVGFMGNDLIQTPALDALAAAGTVFDAAYVTTSICSVSRASILSGQYGRRHGLWGFGGGFRDTAFAKTYPARLRDAGYRTGFVGKYGVGEYEYASRQFDFWAGFDGQGSYRGRTGRDGQPIHLTAWMAEQAEEFIAAARDDTPRFALSVSFKAPHADGTNDFSRYDPAYAEEYEDAWFRQPVQAEVEHYDYFPAAWQEPNEGRLRWRARLQDPRRAQEHLEGYYRLVHGLDVAVGRIVAALEAAGVADNTVIVFTSDNGFYQGEYGLSGKWYASEPSIRVPLLVWDGRARRAQRRGELALNVDLAPTLLDYAGLPPSVGMQGQSLRPLVEIGAAPMPPWRTRFLEEHLWPGPNPIPSVEGIVAPPYKYVRHFRGFREGPVIFEETLDLAVDPHELRNLTASRPALRDSLAAELADLIEELR